MGAERMARCGKALERLGCGGRVHPSL